MRRAALPILLVLVLPALAVGSDLILTNIRFWTAPDHTRVVVDLSGPGSFTHRVLSGPDRIAVDIDRARFRGGTRKISVDDGLVRAIRMNSLRNGAAQVVLDLEKPARCQVFPLAPVSGKPDRVVIDVYRDVRREPDRAALPAEGGVRRIIIDPGHGGDDPGAAGLFGLVEKELVLDIGRRLARKLNARPGYKAVLTRDRDYFLSLRDRQLFARKRGGDIFISLHANSAASQRANGFEIFFLSLRGATNKMARELADKENAADLLGGVPPEAEEEILSILFDFLQEEGMKRSEVLAEELYGAFRDQKEMELRNVKQAGFAVLKSLEIPAVLVEVGFLSNRNDAGHLKKNDFREKVADNLLEGVENYYARTAEESVVYHVVKRGETLTGVACLHQVKLNDLMSINNLSRDTVLEVGQRLRVR